MEEQVKILQQLGLTEYQARAYAALLSRSESTAEEIAKVSEVPITKIYSVLKSLEDMGFLKCTLTRPKYYRPVDVESIVESVLVKRQEGINEMISQREKMISSLGKLYDQHGKKFETPENMVWLVTGLEAGMKEVAKLVKSSKETVRFVSTRDDLLVGSSNIELMSVWAEAVLERGIKIMEIEPNLTNDERKWITNTLLSSFKTTKEKIEYLKTEYQYFTKYNVKQIPKNKDIHFTILIKDSNTVFFLLNHPLYSITPYGLIIYDEKIVKCFIDYFDSLWNVSKSIKDVWLNINKCLTKSLQKHKNK